MAHICTHIHIHTHNQSGLKNQLLTVSGLSPQIEQKQDEGAFHEHEHDSPGVQQGAGWEKMLQSSVKGTKKRE